MAGFGFAGFQLGHFQRQAGLGDGGAALLRQLRPGVGAFMAFGAGERGFEQALRQLHGLRQRARRGRGQAGDLLQREAGHAPFVFGGDFLRVGQVEPGLRLAAVGDGGVAHFKVLARRFQLLAHGGLEGARQLQAVVRGQHVEIRLRQARDQLLGGGLPLHFGQRHLALALRGGDAVGRAVQRLAGVEVETALGETAGVVDGAQVHIQMRARNVAAQPRLRQQPRARLPRPGARRLQLRLGGLQGGVVLARGIVQGHE